MIKLAAGSSFFVGGMSFIVALLTHDVWCLIAAMINMGFGLHSLSKLGVTNASKPQKDSN